MNIYILRHEKRFGKPSFNTSLTPEGINNTIKLSDELEKLDIDIVYCSPFKRIIQTIEPYLKKTGKKVNIEYSLYEFISLNEFCEDDIKSINSDMYGHNYFNLEYESFYDKNNIKFPENINNLKNRTNNFLNFIKKKYNKINILLVTHMSPVNSIINKKKNNNYPQGGLSLIYRNSLDCLIPINFI